MAVIEPVQSIGEEDNKYEKILPSTEPPVKGANESAAVATTSSSSNSNTAGYASVGFETASKADLNDDDVEEGKDGNKEDQVGTTERDDNAEQQQVELNQEQINEKALSEANDAKLEGNTLFKDGLCEEALSKYYISLQAVSSIPSSVELCSVCHAKSCCMLFQTGKI
ncbi:hypothetical protein ACH5RR_003685 [Cinchona calisaya]|uniref:Uncharacterized protein n=1 Tax=Cinchona calisaya TaxID=153742 RepID=A0ABD3AVJ5_9GENT